MLRKICLWKKLYYIFVCYSKNCRKDLNEMPKIRGPKIFELNKHLLANSMKNYEKISRFVEIVLTEWDHRKHTTCMKTPNKTRPTLFLALKIRPYKPGLCTAITLSADIIIVIIEMISVPKIREIGQKC